MFAVYAAPIVLSGEPTFAGYIKLDDTATWMALTDRVMQHGRSLADLAPSTYEATLAFNLGAGYPVGVFLPLGVARALVGQDVAWLIQPYMAFMAALLALGAVVARRAAGRVAAAARAGGLPRRPVGAALRLLPVGRDQGGGGRGARGLDRRRWPRSPSDDGSHARPLVPLAIVSAALIAVLSGGGAVWLAPILVVVLIVFVRLRRLGGIPASRAGAFAAALVVM